MLHSYLKPKIMSLNKGTLHGRKRVLSEAIKLLTKNPSTKGGLVSYELFSGRSTQQPSPSIQTTATTFGCTPELDDNSLLLKTPHTLVIGHGEINWEDQGASSLLTAFALLEIIMQSARGELLPTVLFDNGSHVLLCQHCPAELANWCNSGTNTMTANNNILLGS
jgi:hypothetical protein